MKLRHKVMVTPTRKESQSDWGTPIYEDADPVEVQCNMRQLSSTETHKIGLDLKTVFRAQTTETWPGGPNSTVTWVDEDGVTRHFDQLGAKQVQSAGKYTNNTLVQLLEQGQEVT